MILKSNEEIEKIRQAGNILAKVAKAVLAEAVPGINLRKLNQLTHDLVV